MEYSLQDPIGVDKEGNEISLLDILGTDTDEVLDQVDLRLQTKKLYRCINRVLKKSRKINNSVKIWANRWRIQNAKRNS